MVLASEIMRAMRAMKPLRLKPRATGHVGKA